MPFPFYKARLRTDKQGRKKRSHCIATIYGTGTIRSTGISFKKFFAAFGVVHSCKIYPSTTNLKVQVTKYSKHKRRIFL